MSYCIVALVMTMRLRIRDLREDQDLSQQQIADYLMCDQSLYSKYEREERAVPLEIMVKLAEYYHTSIDYLVGLTDRKTPYPRAKYMPVLSLNSAGILLGVRLLFNHRYLLRSSSGKYFANFCTNK